ncbi:aryl-sulfate sulfotransferase [Salinicoccus carnicancri]|uniref:aryl-sulfate sulfotransferase n=1 Tax=Salinicoccus carnicancri TaxID=558170 RepID=UPI0003110A54|nr:aryl-sulfate sulfotransferase [Salinicoccus carnicancri]
MKKKNIVIVAIIGFAVILLTATAFYGNDGGAEPEESDETGEQPDTEVAEEEAAEADYDYPPEKAEQVLAEQEELESEMLAESEGSTLDNPYVNVDPYNRSPLSALVIFDTEERAKVTFTVKGKDDRADISETVKEYRSHHELPVLGLYPGYTNTIEISAETESGEVLKHTFTVTTEDLPEEMPEIEIKEAQPEKMKLGESELTFYIPSTRYAFAFDVNGDVRWYGSGFNSHVLQELDNGNLLYLGKDDNSGSAYNRLLETTYIGKIHNAFRISEGAAESEVEGFESTLIHHDVAELPSGNLLLTVNDGSDVYMEDTMIEMDRETGEVVKVLDLKDLFPKEVYEKYEPREDNGLIDWFHQNSVVYDESDDSIIISGRHQDTVMKIDYGTGEIKWILAHPEGWNEEMEEYVVDGDGGDFKYPAAQHDATILPDFDDDPETVDVLLLDNNTVVTRGNEKVSEQYSAGTHYRINEETLDAEIIWTYGEELGEDYFTNIISSARYREASGNVLLDFGHTDGGERSSFVEVTHDEQSEIVFEAEMTGFRTGAWAYRSSRNALYNDKWEERFSLGGES